MLTLRTKRKNRHRRVRTIIRHSPDNGETGSAVRAVNKGITVTAVAGVKQFTQTNITGCCVRDNFGIHFPLSAGSDGKCRRALFKGIMLLPDMVDSRQRRALRL